jgi:8-oxo-dGTP diphosphatase
MSYTKIGCEAYIVREGEVLLGKRGKKAKGPWYGTWALPGGHLEFLERADECIVREIQEELAIHITAQDVELAAVTDDLKPERDEHYVHVTFFVDIGPQEPKCNEPDMCEEWRWFPVDELPENIFPPHAKIFDTLHSKEMYKSA